MAAHSTLIERLRIALRTEHENAVFTSLSLHKKIGDVGDDCDICALLIEAKDVEEKYHVPTGRNDLAMLQADLAAFRDARNWQQYHTPEALARAVAVEAGELNELFLWGRNPTLHDVREELADVMIYCLSLCNAIGDDAERIIRDKMAKNAQRTTVGDRLVK